jgi:hypothetical protein
MPQVASRKTMKQERSIVVRPWPAAIQVCAAVLCLLGTGCVQISQTGKESRSIWVLGFARIKVPDAGDGLAQPMAFEITGVGLSLGRAAQLGYFRDFEVHLRPDSNAAVIIVRSKSDLENLKRILTELQQQHLCIVSQS